MKSQYAKPTVTKLWLGQGTDPGRRKAVYLEVMSWRGFYGGSGN
ncbi:MAG: hypothetical protein R2882_15315 [Gemmatimonadales bacterium]